MSVPVTPAGSSSLPHPQWLTPLCDLGLQIAGTELERAITAFERELEAVGIRKLRPHYYLGEGWMVPDDTIGLSIPLYLARPDLVALNAEQDGEEGETFEDLLCYLRHETGHVVNSAWVLYRRPEWEALFGPMDKPYPFDDWPVDPDSKDFVRHAPDNYAQRHPEEDWAETFAVWMTPGFDWRAEYADWPKALAKLEYCDRVMREVGGAEPTVTTVDLSDEVSNLHYTLKEYFGE